MFNGKLEEETCLMVN